MAFGSWLSARQGLIQFVLVFVLRNGVWVDGYGNTRNRMGLGLSIVWLCVFVAASEQLHFDLLDL